MAKGAVDGAMGSAPRGLTIASSAVQRKAGFPVVLPLPTAVLSLRVTLPAGFVLSALIASAVPVSAADLTARQVVEQLYRADPAQPLDFSNQNLRGLDLAGLAFKKARLGNCDLFGADLSGADLRDVDLSAARLDRVVMIGTRFDGAKLQGASLLRPNTRSGFDYAPGETPSFAGADLRDAKMFGVFDGGNFAGANLARATLAPFGKAGFIEVQWRTKLDGADLSGSDLSGADLSYVSLRFANLKGAKLTGATLKHADLSLADLTGADLSGADLTDADLYSAKLAGAIGLPEGGGLSTARNRETAKP